MRARLLVLAGAAVLLAGCGSGSNNTSGNSNSPSNGEALLSGTQVLADAQVAAKTASSVHVSGSGFSGSQPIQVDLTLGSDGANGSLTLGGLEVEIIRAEGNTYIRGSDAFYKHYAGAAAAQLLHDRWLKVPASSGQLKQLGTFTSTDGFFKTLSSGHGKLVNLGLKTYKGQQVVAVHDAKKNATLYVAATGKPYPVAIVKAQGKNTGTLTFSQWNEPFSVSPPKNAMDLSQLGG
jgi:hypothetical protein